MAIVWCCLGRCKIFPRYINVCGIFLNSTVILFFGVIIWRFYQNIMKNIFYHLNQGVLHLLHLTRHIRVKNLLLFNNMRLPHSVVQNTWQMIILEYKRLSFYFINMSRWVFIKQSLESVKKLFWITNTIKLNQLKH